MSKFSTLMDYLDAQNTDSIEGSDGIGSRRRSSSVQHQLSVDESTVDSMPNSPPAYSSRRQYVWDEIDNNRPQNQYSEHSGSASSRSKSSARRDEESTNNQDSAAVIQMTQAVKYKVDTIKADLRNRTDSLKELQTELARVRNAIERKQDKCIKMWESRLVDLSDEQNKILSRQRIFLDKMEGDMKDLRLKDSALKEKIHCLISKSDDDVRKILITGQKKKERLKSQLIIDEKKYFEKILDSKMENMKNIAAKSVGQKLDTTVTEYRESILNATEDYEKKILILQSSLENELNDKFVESLEKIKVDKGQDVDRNRKVIDGGALDGKKRQEDEIKQLKEKFKRARNVLEEREEHSRKEESEKFINNLDKLRKEVEKQRRELNENHQRTLSQTIRNNNDKKKKFEKQINDENILWENNFRSKIRKNKMIKKKKKQEILELKNAAETEKIIKRLKFEAEEERENIKKSFEMERNRVQDDAYRATDILLVSGNRSSKLLKNMRIDIANLKLQKETFEKNDARLIRECSDNRNILASRRTTLNNAEALVYNADLKFKSMNDLKDSDGLSIDSLDNESKEEKSELSILKEKFQQNKENREKEILTADTANEDEFRKIKEKVNSIIEKKIQCINDSSLDLNSLERECSRLENILEDLRRTEH